jgi:hypothetical protein
LTIRRRAALRRCDHELCSDLMAGRGAFPRSAIVIFSTTNRDFQRDNGTPLSSGVSRRSKLLHCNACSLLRLGLCASANKNGAVSPPDFLDSLL